MNDENPASAPRSHLPGKEGNTRQPPSSVRERLSKSAPCIISVIAVIISALTYLDQHNTDRAAANSAEQVYAAKVSFWPVNELNDSSHAPRLLFMVEPPSFRLTSQSNAHYFTGYSRSSTGITYYFQAPETTAEMIGVTVEKEPQSALLIQSGYVQIVIENQANTPISNVDLAIDAWDSTGMALGTRIIDVGTVPPCSTARVTSLQHAVASLMNTAQATTQNGTFTITPPTIGLASMAFTDSLGIRWERVQNGALVKYTGRQVSGSSIENPISSHISTAPGCSGSQ
jgi:hypothetical protein